MTAKAKILSLLFVNLLLVAMLVLPAMADEQKIGFVYSTEIFTKYKTFSDMQQKLDKEVEEWRQKAQIMQAKLDSLALYIKGEISVAPPRLPFHALSDSKQQEKQDEFKTEKTALDDYLNTIFGPDGSFERRNAELTQPILDKINSIISEIAQEEEYTYIFDAVAGNIAYADERYNITETVIEELNKEVE